MSYLREQIQRYSLIRLWGSVGFILTVVALGIMLDQWGVVVIPYFVLILFLGIFANSLLVPEKEAVMPEHDQGSIMQVLRRGEVIAFLLVCFLMQASHGPYYVFFAPYMTTHGFSISFVGGLIALGVIAEVVVFLTMHRWNPQIELRTLLVISLLLAAVRWLLLALFPQYVSLVVVAQILHAATFGVYHVAAIQLIHLFFTGRHQGKGQALYSSVSFGAGGDLTLQYSRDDIGESDAV